MKIMLVNVDCRWNLAIRRMYNYFRVNHDVEMVDLGLSGYPHKRTEVIDATGYDRVYVSNIFDNNKDRVMVIGCDWVEFGGIGSNNPEHKLPSEIENTDPFYYDDEDTSYGFITRGCIRKCWFCKVPKFEGDLKFYNNIEKIVKHKKVKFMDNNILAYEKHCEVFQWLIDRNIKCDFNQGLDFRLVNDENMELLSKLNYMGEYKFAFDDPKYQKLLEKKLVIMKRWIPQAWKFKFYIYFHPSMNVSELLGRIEWCRQNECLPYVMRDRACWESEENLKNFLIDITAYCNQPSLFKKITFEDFLIRRHKNKERIAESLNIYENAKVI